MRLLKSWWALLVREYLEHRMAFVYFPLGILTLLALSSASGLAFNRVRLFTNFSIGNTLKIYELGYLVMFGLWFAYLAVALFFYFGDAFSADRRNNAMFFWKSMPVSDLRILASKFLAGTTMFPLLVIAVAAISGLLLFLVLNIAAITLPGVVPPDPLQALLSFGQITLFGLVYVGLALLWYAPFLAWVGGLSTVFGRWSLPLAFIIPGMLSVIENMVAFGRIPRGGYIWGYLSQRWQFGLDDHVLEQLFVTTLPFDARYYLGAVLVRVDWVGMGTGVVFAAFVMWLASEYRRRRIA